MTRHYRGCVGPDLVPAFRHAREMPHAIHSNPARHTVLHEPDIFDRVGFATADEGAVLHQCAKAMPGRWLELGTWTGWTARHIGEAGVEVVCVDPEFSHAGYNQTGDAKLFLQRFMENTRGCRGCIVPVGKRSDDFFATFTGEPFDACFVDAEHEPPYPLNDAKMLLPWMRPDCCVAWHDVLSPHVQAGVRYLVEAGFRWRLYKTAQLVAVAWRGAFVPPAHMPDPSFNWDAWIGGIGFDKALLARQS